MHSHPRAGKLACAVAALGISAGAFAGLASAAPDERPVGSGSLRSLLDAPGPAGPAQVERLLSGLPPRAAAPQRRQSGVHPVAGRVGYGEAIAAFGVQRAGHVHQGQDIFAPAGTPLRAVRDATVTGSGSGDGRGNWVALHSRRDRRTYVYFHMQRPAAVDQGERVRAGQRIGRLGCTGSCFGDHLHFEVHRGRATSGAAIDPMPLLRRWAR
jgi:murein DD-endopeptidase MepM/ murein hydrolase activator NlpD